MGRYEKKLGRRLKDCGGLDEAREGEERDETVENIHKSESREQIVQY